MLVQEVNAYQIEKREAEMDRKRSLSVHALQKTLVFSSALLDRLKTREIRQANDNCNTQQLTSKVVLNCNCTCIGVCLRRKAQQLNNLLLALTASITFPELGLTGNQIGVIIISGVNVPTSKTIFQIKDVSIVLSTRFLHQNNY